MQKSKNDNLSFLIDYEKLKFSWFCRSDYFSFLDDGPQDLAPQGNGGMRQMYNYSGLDGQPMSQVPVTIEGDKKSKMQYSMEDIEQMRNSEFPSVKRT